MYQYANSFSYSSNTDSGEFLLAFRQQYPVLDEKGSVKEITVDPIAEIVLNKAGLIALRCLLDQINLE